MNIVIAWRFAMASGFVAALLPLTAARAETFAQHASQILEAGWKPAGQGLAAAEAAHAQSVAIDGDDSRADYALALAQMRASKWDAAGMSLTEAVRKSPHDLYAWRARVWLLLYERKFNDALAEIDRLAGAMPKVADGDAQAEARWQAAAKIMGRSYGYIGGPRSGAIKADDLAAHEAKLMGRLTPERQRAFAEGRAEIATAYEEALAAIDAEKQSIVETEEGEKDAQREFVESERARMATEVTGLQEQAASAKDQLDAEVSLLDQELTPIQQRHAQVQFAAQPFVQRLADLDRRLSFALAEANRSDIGDGKDAERVRRDRERRDAALREADALRLDIRREQEFLRPYQIESQNLQLAAAAVEQRRAAAIGTYRRTVGSLDAALRKLGRIEKQLRVSERELAKPVGSTSAKTTDLKSRLPLLTTYEKFPLEQERLRLIKEFASR